MSALKFEKRGLGYFGDGNDKLKAHHETIQASKSMTVDSQTLATDESGVVKFVDIPIGTYLFEVGYS